MKKTTLRRSNINLLAKLIEILKTTFIGSFFNRVQREFRKNKTVKLKSQNLFKSFLSVISTFAQFRKDFLRKAIIVLSVSIIATFLYINIRQYNSIEFTAYSDRQIYETTPLDSVEYNIMMGGFDNPGSSENKYLETIVIMSLNVKTGTLKTYGINPNFITTINSKKYTLKTLWNNTHNMRVVQDQVQNLVGIRLDRYVAFDTNDLKNLITDWNLELKTNELFKYEKDIYQPNSIIKGNVASEYVFSSKSALDNDTSTQRYLNFFNQVVQNNRSIFTYYRAFWESEKLSKIFHSDMNKDEFLRFLNGLFNSNLPIQTAYLSYNSATLGNTGAEDGLLLNILDVDEKIKILFQDINIIREQAEIEIFNASTKPGLASQRKRIFQNLGINVINSGNYPEKLDKNILYIPKSNENELLYNISAIKRFFGNNIEIVLGEYKYNYSGDLILVLGET